MKTISIIIPVFNEEACLPDLFTELKQLLQVLPDAEIILVDDGSTDRSWSMIERASRETNALTGLRLQSNQGQSMAMLRGLYAAKGVFLVTMDGDMQNNPADIPDLIAPLSDVDVVCGYRINRRDSWSRRMGSRVGNKVRNWVTRDGIRDTGCSLKAFHASCLHDLPAFDGVHRFMPAFFKLNGRTVLEVPVSHRPRLLGTSKYSNLNRLPRTLLDLIGFWWYRRRFLPDSCSSTKGEALEPSSGLPESLQSNGQVMPDQQVDQPEATLVTR